MKRKQSPYQSSTWISIIIRLGKISILKLEKEIIEKNFYESVDWL